MYEYNFKDRRKKIKAILENYLEERKKIYYQELEIYNKQNLYDNKKIYNDQLIKKKKIIIKNLNMDKINNEKEYIQFENETKIKFQTFYNCAFGLFDMTSYTIHKNIQNIQFEYIIFKDCIFKNINFEECIFIGCDFIGCKFFNVKFKKSKFFDFKSKGTVYFYSSNFENCIFERVNMKRNIFQLVKIKNTRFILSNLRNSIFDQNTIDSMYISDCDLKSFSMINTYAKKLEFDDDFLTKLNEDSFFDKFIINQNDKEQYINLSRIYKDIASKFESNRILGISGEYHYLYKYSQKNTLNSFSKLKSQIFWSICGYGEKPIYCLITSFEIVLLFAIIYLFTGINVGGKQINYDLSIFFMLNKKIIIVDFLESLYFSLVTFTTVGYGDIIPTGISIVLSSIEMILGVTMVGIWTATLARKITR